MRKLYTLSAFVLINLCAKAQNLFTYDFGTQTGDHTSGISETFLTGTPTNGGTYRLRVGTGSGGFSLSNYGYAGSGSELRMTAPSGGSANKFSVYDFSNPTTFSSLRFDVYAVGSLGSFYFLNGDGASFSDNNTFSASQTFAGVLCTLSPGGLMAVQYHNGTAWTTLGTGILPISQKVTIELYCNNATSGSVNYQRPLDANVYSVSAGKIDVWVNGFLGGDETSKSGLAAGNNIDSWMIYAVNSTGNTGIAYIDNIIYANSNTLVLPIQLSAFSAFNTGKNVLLQWKTASENEVDRFEIERSADNRNFEKAGTVKAANLTAGSTYQFTDDYTVTAKTFYRLKSVDKNGSYAYSSIQTVDGKISGTIQLVNNPVKDVIKINLKEAKGSINIVDVTGKRVYTGAVNATTMTINASTLTPGLYFVQYLNGDQTEVLKVVKE